MEMCQDEWCVSQTPFPEDYIHSNSCNVPFFFLHSALNVDELELEMIPTQPSIFFTESWMMCHGYIDIAAGCGAVACNLDGVQIQSSWLQRSKTRIHNEFEAPY